MTGEGRWRVALAGIFVVSLLLRAAFWWEIADLAVLHRLVLDAAAYDRMAQVIAAGVWDPRQHHMLAPLYSCFLAGIYQIAGHSYAAVRLVQLLFGALTPVLVALLAAGPFGRRAAVVAGFLGAFYGPLVCYTPLLLKETLAVFLLTAALLLVTKALRADASHREGSPTASGPAGLALVFLAVGGLLLGGTIQLRENLLVLVPVVALWVALSAPWRRSILGTLVLLVACGLTKLPIAWLNHRAGSPWLTTGGMSGASFYIGNVLSTDGAFASLGSTGDGPQDQWVNARRIAAGILAEREGRNVAPLQLGDDEAAGILLRESRRIIAADPARWVVLFGRKVWLFWNDYEITDGEGYAIYRQLSGTLALAWLGFGTLSALAVLGLAAAWQRDRRFTLALVMMTGAVFASVVAFFVLARFRLPLAPLLLPLAGLGVVATLEAMRQRRWGELARRALPALLVAALVHVPLPNEQRTGYELGCWFNLGNAASRWSDELLTEAIATREPVPRAIAAQHAARRGAEAAHFLGTALELSPDFYVARATRAASLQRWGSALLLLGDRAGASQRYRAALDEIALAQASFPSWGKQEDADRLMELRRVTQGNLALAASGEGGP